MSEIKRVVLYDNVLDTLENLPFTNDTIHEDDVQLIIKLLLDNITLFKGVVVEYCFKIVDHRSFSDFGTYEKIDTILGEKTIEKCIKSELNDEDMSFEEMRDEILLMREEMNLLKDEIKELRKLLIKE